MTLTQGTEVWTEVDGVMVGKIKRAFYKTNELWVECVTVTGRQFERRWSDVQDIRVLYKIAG